MKFEYHLIIPCTFSQDLYLSPARGHDIPKTLSIPILNILRLLYNLIPSQQRHLKLIQHSRHRAALKYIVWNDTHSCKTLQQLSKHFSTVVDTF